MPAAGRNQMGLKCCRLTRSSAQFSDSRKAARKPRTDAPAKTTSPHRTTETGIPTTVGGRFRSTPSRALSVAFEVARFAGPSGAGTPAVRSSAARSSGSGSPRRPAAADPPAADCAERSGHPGADRAASALCEADVYAGASHAAPLAAARGAHGTPRSAGRSRPPVPTGHRDPRARRPEPALSLPSDRGRSAGEPPRSPRRHDRSLPPASPPPAPRLGASDPPSSRAATSCRALASQALHYSNSWSQQPH